MSEATASASEGYQQLRHGAGAAVLDRDFVWVEGPDAQAFLQGQLSQDILTLAVGQAAPALLLSPQGKLVALLRVLRTGEQAYLLDVDAGWGGGVVERLRRFMLRTDCQVEPRDWRCVAVRGPQAAERVASATLDPETLAAEAHWPALPGVDLVGPDPTAPEGVALVEARAWELARIEAGIPVMGAEITEKTIPASAGVVEASVSFTKGCYTGQELVARIDSRGGNVPRRLCSLSWSEPAEVLAGADVVVGEGDQAEVVGQVTSAASRLDAPGGVALAYLGRAVEVPASMRVAAEGGEWVRAEAVGQGQLVGP